MCERVILVDPHDGELGTAEKLTAHAQAKLHRAFSVFIFDSAGRLLLQQRAFDKYHSGGLWSNTCCGHPRPGEQTIGAAHRRLAEEMGFECSLEVAFAFVYQTEVGNGLVEHEYDHVLHGHYDGEPKPNPAEAAGWRWAEIAEIRQDVRTRPGRYTVWFPFALDLMSVRGMLLPPARRQAHRITGSSVQTNRSEQT